MKVYIVIQVENSYEADVSIVGVFEAEDRAKSYTEHLKEQQCCAKYYDYYYDEWEVVPAKV